MSKQPHKVDALIIGSGISSLTCAALLSKKGKSVVVLEQYNKAGGYLHNFSRFGERFDTGAHYVGAMGEGQPFRVLLEYLGVYDESLFVPLDPRGFDVLRFPSRTVVFPKGYEAAINELSNQFPGERAAIQTYFDRIRKVVSCFPTYEFTDASDVEIPIEALETSLEAMVESLTSNPELRTVFYSYCVLHGVRPEHTPFAFHAIVTDSLIRGPYGLAQGGDALTQKFIKQIESCGGRVLTKRRVVSLSTTNDTVTQVVTEDGETFESDWVISGIHPKATLRLLSHPEKLSPAFRSRVQGLQESPGIFGLYAACSSPPPFDPLRNYYFFDSSDPASLLEEATQTCTPKVVFLSPARRIPVANQKLFPLNLHSSSPSTWFSKWNESRYGKRPEEYEELKNSIAEKMFGLVERYEPGFRSSVSRFVTSTPLTNLHFNGSEEGSSYGIYHSIQNTGARSLGPRTKVLNLLLTGQNCLFPGLLGAAVSALRTSGHIIGIKSTLSELKQRRQAL